MLATIQVTTLEDDTASVVDDGIITLREAIEYSNGTILGPLDGQWVSSGSPATPGTHDLIDLTGLTGVIEFDAGGEMSVTNPVSIIGPGSDLLTIDASTVDGPGIGDGSRHFVFSGNDGLPVELIGVTLTGADSNQTGGSVESKRDLFISDVVFANNRTVNFGGALYIQGTAGSSVKLSISEGRFVNNQALPQTNSNNAQGGAIWADVDSYVIDLSHFEGNTAGSRGGAIYVSTGRAGGSIQRSTFESNSAGTPSFSSASGGALHLLAGDTGTNTILNSTFNGNAAIGNPTSGQGGAIYMTGGPRWVVEGTTFDHNEAGQEGGAVWTDFLGARTYAYFNSSTIVDNIAPIGAGIFNATPTDPTQQDGGWLRFRNSIVAGNKQLSGAAQNLSGPFDPTSAYNLIGPDVTGVLSGVRGNIVATNNDPLLSPLADFGGSTETRPPLPGSGAVGSGDPGEVYDAKLSDQRGAGFARVLGSRREIGAVELNEAPVIPGPEVGAADVVFLFDQSGSGTGAGEAPQVQWVQDAAISIQSELSQLGIRDNRYAIAGFGARTSGGDAGSSEYAYTSLIGADPFANALKQGDALARLELDGEAEDGWDAIEHAIAEYEFRPNAMVHFVLVTDEGRNNLNASLTRDVDPEVADHIQQILATRNATLTSVVFAQFSPDGSADTVLGVKPSLAGSPDSHPSIEFDESANAVLFSTFEADVEPFNALPTIPGAFGTRETYVELAWATGGSAWNITNLQQYPLAATVANFAEQFAKTFAEITSTQERFYPNRIIQSVNFGGAGVVPAFPDAEPSVTSTDVVAVNSLVIDIASKSIPLGTEDAFYTAIEAADEEDLSIPFVLPNGNYEVELYFAEIGTEVGRVAGDRIFDVLLQGETVLNDYEIRSDRAKVIDVAGTPQLNQYGRLAVGQAGFGTAVVKVFAVEVIDGTLQIDLEDAGGSLGPVLNAVRILDADVVWLLGDFNDSGLVDAADYTVWRDTFGTSVDPHTGADHNGNGLVDNGDYLIWAENYSGSLRFIGDYNLNGIVDAADYTVWKDSYNTVVTPGTGADADGDGLITTWDWHLWARNYGASFFTPPIVDPSILNIIPGDFDRSGVVDLQDYLFWEMTQGDAVLAGAGADANAGATVDLNDLALWQTIYAGAAQSSLDGDFNGDGVVSSDDLVLWEAGDLAADANSDGNVDSLDFDIWELNEGRVHSTAWPSLVNAFGGGTSIDEPEAPYVVGFAVGDSASGVYDLTAVAGTGEQLRSVPLAAVDRVTIAFSEQVLVTQADLQIENLDGLGPAPTVSDFIYDLSANTATWVFSSPLSDGRHLVRVSDRLRDLDGDALDGEFTNPWTLSDIGAAGLASGDGEAGGAFRFRFTLLAGDTDHNNVDGLTDYTNWLSIEPGMVHVSRTDDEWDADLSFGDVSLREAVNHANLSGEPTTIVLPTGRYMITRAGTEATSGHDISMNDLNVLGDVRIVGDGPGLSVVDLSNLSVNAHRRAFEVMGGGASLELNGLTVTDGSAYYSYKGVAAKVHAGSSLLIQDSAIVNNFSLQEGTAVYSLGGDLTIRRSVFTNNESVYKGGQAVYAIADGATGGSLTIGETIFAINWDRTPSGSGDPNVLVGAGVALTNEGRNLYDDATGGFFDTTPGVDDYLGTPDYVVSTLVDDWDHSDDLQSLSLREAVDLANQAPGSSEIWLPAWDFKLTRDRATYGGGSLTDTDVAYGDLDISESVVLRGVQGRTSVGWKSGVTEKVFDLIGDVWDHYSGPADTVDGNDLWAIDFYKTNGFYSSDIDVDSDGDIDQADYDLAFAHLGNTLDLIDIAVL